MCTPRLSRTMTPRASSATAVSMGMIWLTISSAGIATAVEGPLHEADQVVFDQVFQLGELFGPEHRRDRAGQVLEGQLGHPGQSRPALLHVLTWTLAIMPPRMTSVFSGTPASSATRWVASASSKRACRVRGWLDM